MMYYRLALHNQHTSTWVCKSTVLTALDAIFQLLRVFRPLAPERVRVFSACCKEELNRMLDLENNGMGTGSVTVAAFLRAGNPQAGKAAQRRHPLRSRARSGLTTRTCGTHPGNFTCLLNQ